MVGVTVAGDFLASPAFTIDVSDQSRVMTFKFNYKATVGASNANWSGTSSNSFGVAIYSVTDSAWIIPAGVFSMTQSSGIGYATGTFQTSSTGVIYRFVMYQPNATSGGNVALSFDDFFVGPQTAPMGPAMTDAVSFTPVLSASTTPPTLGAGSIQNGSYRRVGDSLEVWVDIAFGSSGTNAGSGTYRLTLPNSLTVDTAKLIQTSLRALVGDANIVCAGTNYDGVNIEVTGTTPGYVQLSRANTVVTNASPGAWTANDVIKAHFTVPISGWSSNVLMSQDTDTRVVAARYTSTSVASVTTAAPVNYETAVFDTHAAVTVGASWKFTAPVTGYYEVNAQYYVSGTPLIRIYKNGTNYSQGNIGSVNTPTCISDTVQLNAGEYIDIRADNTYTLACSAANSHIAINRISGPAVVAATESVNARYSNIAGTSIANSGDVQVPYATKDFDSHSAFATPTFTVPVTGKYCVYAVTNFASSTYAVGNQLYTVVYKNGAVHSAGIISQVEAIVTQSLGSSVYTTVSCVAGDTIDIRTQNTRTAGATLLNTTAGTCFFTIERIGN